MDNQHRKINGYRELTQEEIDAMNAIKEKAQEIKELVDRINAIENVDKRWLQLAEDDIQKGFMSLTRSVAKPTTY